MTDNCPAPNAQVTQIIQSEDVQIDISVHVSKMQAVLNSGKDLSEAEMAQFNAQLNAAVEIQITAIKKTVCSKLELKSTDTVDQKKAKLSASEGVISYFQSVTSWIGKQLNFIFSKIKEGIKWCYEKVKGVFSKFFSYIGF